MWARSLSRVLLGEGSIARLRTSAEAELSQLLSTQECLLRGSAGISTSAASLESVET